MSPSDHQTLLAVITILSVALVVALGCVAVLVARRNEGKKADEGTMDFLSEEERRKLADEADPADEGALEEDEKQMIRNLFEIGDTTAVEVMTPRIDIDALPVSSTLDDTMKELCENKRSRIPVYDESIDNIIGVLNAKDMMDCLRSDSPRPFALREMLRPALFVPESKPVVDLLREMRHTRNHMAVVVDEFGGTSGLVSIEDILEEIVGEIYDEKDLSAPRVEELRPGVYQVDPMISLEDLEEELHVKILAERAEEELDVETLGGLIQAKLGAMPRKGSRVTVGPIQARVLKMDGLRIVRALVFVRGEEEKAEKSEKD